MKRRDFFKNIGIGAAGAIIAPSLIIKSFNNGEKLTEEQHEILSQHHYYEAMHNNGIFTCLVCPNARVNDTIMVSNNGIENMFMINKVNNALEFEAINLKQDEFLHNGKVMVMLMGTNFRKG